MQTIGEKLEEARKRKGISVREAAETTKIRGDYLQKFEANAFDIDLPPLYIRGFLRAYARYLDLDAERFLAEYDSVIASEGRGSRRESREVYGRVEFGEGGGEAAAGGRTAQEQAVMLKFGLLIGGAIVAIVVIILLINVLFFRAPARAATPPASQTAALQAEADQTLTLTAVEATRVKVVQSADGKVLFNDALARGKSTPIRKQGKLLITVEAGKNLRMEVNGRSYPVPLDGYGRFALD
jgi:cytoskeletal protein RodZ